MLKSSPYVTTGQFLEARISRFPQRIAELKEYGYRVEGERMKNSPQWRYRLSEGESVRRETAGGAPSDPVSSPSESLFDMPANTTRSAVTGELMDEAA